MANLSSYECVFRMTETRSTSNSKTDPIYGQGRQSAMAGLMVTQQQHDCLTKPFEVGHLVEGHGGDSFKVISVRKIS